MNTKMTTDEAREHLVEYMEANFSDRTFHRYIRGQRGSVSLAGDFAWQLAMALKKQAATHAVLLEFYKASTGWANTVGHEDATLITELKAEERYDAALVAARNALTAAGVL